MLLENPSQMFMNISFDTNDQSKNIYQCLPAYDSKEVGSKTSYNVPSAI